jgi:ABC-type uncharacterized transport system auxiliary subunit
MKHAFAGRLTSDTGARMKVVLTALACLALLAACDNGNPPPRIYDAQRNALDKAKNVQDTLLQADQRQRQAQDEQTK